jgi:hypothetical protein
MSKTNRKIVLKNISAIQTILAGYSKTRKVIDIEDDTNELPQTIIGEDEEKDIPVSELLHEKSKRSMYFLDTRKMKTKFWCNLIDITQNGPLPQHTKNPCWWCRNTFKTQPIGCPLKYNEKDEEAGFFNTEGFFCSFSCCKAYILDQKSSPKYKESLTLLSLLFFKLYNCKPDFPTAPSWKLLKEHGGHLTINEFRSSLGKLVYRETVNTRTHMYCSSQCIEEKKIKSFRGVTDVN